MRFKVFLLLYFVFLSPIEGDGICYRPGTPVKVCCANYQSVDGQCTECPRGTYSDPGEICKECTYGFYGKRCLEDCNCQENERCDSVHGCLGSTTTTYRFNTTCKGNVDNNDKVIFYAGGGGLLVIGILLGILLTGIKNKCCSQRGKSEHKNDGRQHPAEEAIEINRYEYIDEENITDQNPNIVPPSLPVQRKLVQHHGASNKDYTNSKDGPHCIRIEDEGYLNPYQPIQEANIYKHEYKAISSAITKNKVTDEYLHPYNSLLKHSLSKGHEYRDLRNENIKSELKSSESDKCQSFV